MKAIIFGVTGQDGSYLADLLLEKGYLVYGVARRVSTDNTQRIKRVLDNKNFFLVTGDVTDQFFVHKILNEVTPDEVYNLAAQSHVGVSFNNPNTTIDITFGGCLNLLNTIRSMPKHERPKMYQASSSEMFGSEYSIKDGNPIGIELDTGKIAFEKIKYQDENTNMVPNSPYAVAKLAAHNMCRVYRESYGMFVSCGILFNHESERRGENFVTRKITKWLGEFDDWRDGDNGYKATENELFLTERTRFPKLRLGNIDAVRDWGFAGDYCVDYDVCLLTPKGWKFRNGLNVGDEVINFNKETNSISIDTINNIYDTTSNGDRYNFSGRGVSFSCTENHRIYYQKKSKSSKGGWSDWKIATAKEMYEMFSDISLRTKYDFRFPGFSNSDIEEYDISDDHIYLLGCLLAEGSLESKYANGIKISLSQSYIANEQTHKKIESILINLKYTYRTRNRNDGVTEWVLSSESSEELLKLFDVSNVHICPKYVYSFSQRQSKILFDALMDCDGCWGNMTYSSKRNLLAVDFQSVAHLAGYMTSDISENDGTYIVGVLSRKNKYKYVQEISLSKNNSEEVWCVNTNNGTIITRDNNKIFISGNCQAMWLMLQHNEPDDFVIATGEAHSVKDFLEIAFDYFDMKYKHHIVIDPKFYRPCEVEFLHGSAEKAKKVLGWEPKVSFNDLVERMCHYDWLHSTYDANKRKREEPSF